MGRPAVPCHNGPPVAHVAQVFPKLAVGPLPLRQVGVHGGHRRGAAPTQGTCQKEKGQECRCDRGHHRRPKRKERLPNAIRGFDGNKKINGESGTSSPIPMDGCWPFLCTVPTCTAVPWRHCTSEGSGNPSTAPLPSLPMAGIGRRKCGKRHWLCPPIVMGPDSGEKFKAVTKRWVVERSFAGMNPHRRLSRGYEFL